MLTNEMTGNRIQNNAQSAVLVVAVAGCCTERLENVSFRRKTIFDAESEVEGKLGAFDDVQLNFILRHLKKSLNGPHLCIFHAIVLHNRAGHSARCLDDVPLHIYFVIFSN